MAVNNYSKFKILIDPDSTKIQGLKVGDVVKRQYYDARNLIYSMMVVLETGIEIIGDKGSSYFIGALIDGDEPKNGEPLDFVKITSLLDKNRGGALYLTASDSDSPFMDVIDGVGYEKSICYPYMGGGDSNVADKNRYACPDDRFATSSYFDSDNDVCRIFKIERNNTPTHIDRFGLKQALDSTIENPQRFIISFKTRASKQLKNIPISLSTQNDNDGKTILEVNTNWEYKLVIFTAEYPKTYKRYFNIDLTESLTNNKDWFEIAELNIIRVSDLSNLSKGTKGRIGKINGIADPIFGTLNGYGAYFQNLYATKNVNIAGTLTAGDEKGFGSTFYVGRIHKNVILNSIDCKTIGNSLSTSEEKSPVGIGKVWVSNSDLKFIVQSRDWRTSHIGKWYCFSIWIKPFNDYGLTIPIYQDEHLVGNIIIEKTSDWQRYFVAFVIKESYSSNMTLSINNLVSGCLLTAPQLEAGTNPSQYQPTDANLSYVEDYGAWFSKGGIGGTIQNPLLRLNDNGSISSADQSFVIRPDGTGYFADGRFEWSKDTITLKDVTLKWGSLAEETQEILRPITIEIVSKSGFSIVNNNYDVDATAKLFRNGKELDNEGKAYLYSWNLWDQTGTTIKKTFTGKSITVSRNDIFEKAVLTCEVTDID